MKLRARGPAAFGTTILSVTVIVAAAWGLPRPADTGRVSENDAGAAANSHSFEPAMTPDGRHVAFSSHATNLDALETTHTANNAEDLFVKDTSTGRTARISVSREGGVANGRSHFGAISDDGRFVAFRSNASNLVAGDVNATVDAFVHDRDTDDDGVFDEPDARATQLVSVATDGRHANEPNHIIGRPSISPDGRHVTFSSKSDDLATGDANGVSDVFVRDLDEATTTLVSVDAAGAAGNGASQSQGGTVVNSLSGTVQRGSAAPVMSAGGRYIGFSSMASNLVAGDTNGERDVFVRDLSTGRTVRVSLNSQDEQTKGSGSNGSYSPVLSADGRFVLFNSQAQQLVPADRNEAAQPGFISLDNDVFVRDRDLDADGIMDEAGAVATRRVNVRSDGGEGNGFTSEMPSISSNGRHAVFESNSSDLVGDDTDDKIDVFVHDLLTGVTEKVSDLPAENAGDVHSMFPSVSSDGERIAYYDFTLSTSTQMKLDTVFRRDRGPELGVAGLQAALADGEAVISGRLSFTGRPIATASDARGDGATGADAAGADLVGAAVVARPERDDLLIRLNLSRLTVNFTAGALTDPESGSPGTQYAMEFTSGGRRFEVRVTAESERAALYELHDCTDGCERVATLPGSYGSAGEDIWVTLTPAQIGAEEGDHLTGVRAFTAKLATAGPDDWDELELPDAVLPARTVAAAVAPAATPETAVVFGAPEPPADDGKLEKRLDASGLEAGDYRAWIKTCLGSVCESTSTPFSVPGATPTPTPEASPTATPTTAPGDEETHSPSTLTANLGGLKTAATPTIRSSSRLARYRQAVAFSGAVPAEGGCGSPARVEILRRRLGTAAYRRVASAAVSRARDWRVLLRPRVNAVYAARAVTPNCATATSSPVKVLVGARVSVRRPRSCRSPVRGRVLPAQPQTTVLLQRRSSGRWHTRASARLDRRSRFRLPPSGCRRGWRVLWPSQNLRNTDGTARLRR